MQKIEYISEPYVLATMVVPDEFVGVVMELGQERRGEFKNMEYITPERVRVEYEMPLSEILMDFF